MKRLIKKSSTISLFHGTLLSSFAKIVESGSIIPQRSYGGVSMINDKSDDHEKMYSGFVFLTDDYDNAEWYARGLSVADGHKEAVVVLEVNVDSENLLPDDIECQECETWEEALEKVSQVKFRGQIPVANINNVYIISMINSESIDTSISSWKQDYEANKEKFELIETKPE